MNESTQRKQSNTILLEKKKKKFEFRSLNGKTKQNGDVSITVASAIHTHTHRTGNLKNATEKTSAKIQSTRNFVV